MVKPIIFSANDVRAILDGRKVQTRRAVKPQVCIRSGETKFMKWLGGRARFGDEISPALCDRTPPYQPGDVLWVRETWCELAHVDAGGYTHYDDCSYFYATGGDFQIDLYDGDGFLLNDQRMKWCPSTRMPREAARIFLRVTDVRVERVQEISDADAWREGVDMQDVLDLPCRPEQAAIAVFSGTWDAANAKRGYSWETNPFVWVITFERCEKPKQF
jgi:hypothetical protein